MWYERLRCPRRGYPGGGERQRPAMIDRSRRSVKPSRYDMFSGHRAEEATDFRCPNACWGYNVDVDRRGHGDGGRTIGHWGVRHVCGDEMCDGMSSMDANAQKSARERDAVAPLSSGFDIWQRVRVAHRKAARNRSGERRAVLLAQLSVGVELEERKVLLVRRSEVARMAGNGVRRGGVCE